MQSTLKKITYSIDSFDKINIIALMFKVDYYSDIYANITISLSHGFDVSLYINKVLNESAD